MRQAEALSHRSGQSLEDATQAVSDTQAGRQLRDLANGEHRHEKARSWQAGVFWDRERGTDDAPLLLGGSLADCRRTPIYLWLERTTTSASATGS